VQFVGDLAALFFLHADKLTIEPAVLVPRRAKRGREGVESCGEDSKLLDLRQRKAVGVVALLKAEHALGELRERIEKAPEHDIKNEKISAFSVSHTIASEEKSRQASAISSDGCPMMITGLA
jgi:hypothetical protein